VNDTLATRIDELLWHPQLELLRGPPRVLLVLLRFLNALVRDIASGMLTLRAMGLVYVTILSIVPVIAISFSVLKAFGYHRQLEPLLYNFLLPLGERGEELTSQVIGFVDNTQGNVLAGVGLALLFFTTLSMAQKVEDSFNYVWRVNRPRNLGKRLSEYLAVLLVGPVVMVTAMTLLATLQGATSDVFAAVPGVATVLGWFGRLVPYLLVCGAFTFIYWFVPNTRVWLRAALAGGIVGGILWATTGALFAAFVVGSTRMLTIYATFAIVISALVWLHLCWLILLIGAQVSFYVQHPEYLRMGYHEPAVGSRQREQTALTVMLLVGQNFRTGSAPLSIPTLAARLGLPVIGLEPILSRLDEAGLLSCTADDELLPQREPARITLRDIIAAVRDSTAVRQTGPGSFPEPVANISGRMQAALEQALGEETLADLLDDAEKGAGHPVGGGSTAIPRPTDPNDR
jgi:membrane protein